MRHQCCLKDILFHIKHQLDLEDSLNSMQTNFLMLNTLSQMICGKEWRTFPVLRFTFLRLPTNSAKVPDTTRTVEPGTRSLYFFAVDEPFLTESEAFLDTLLDLDSATDCVSSLGSKWVSTLSILELRFSSFCSSSKARSIFSCSSFACLKIASMSTSDTGLGLLICFFLRMWKEQLQIRKTGN